MSADVLRIEHHAGVVTLRFRRHAAFNALDLSLAQAFHAACQALFETDGLRVVVLRGEGRAFMAGGDLRAMQADPVATADALIGPMHAAIRLLHALPAPVIACVQGPVAGAGLSLMAAADLAIAADDARFSFAYADIATSCDLGASWSLPRLLGLRRAMDLALLGDVIDADEALRIGLVTRVLPRAGFEADSDALVARVATREPHVLAHLKRLFRSGLDNSLETQLDAERGAFLDNAARPQFVAAIDRFFTRRAR